MPQTRLRGDKPRRRRIRIVKEKSRPSPWCRRCSLSFRHGFVAFASTVILVSAGAVGSIAALAGRAAVSQNLDAGFDADGNIYLTFADGTRIGTPSPPGTVIPAGTYTIALNNNGLDDLGNPHEFHLFGPGVNLSAGTAIQATWTATFLPASSYTYQDDLNPTTIHDVFGTPGSGATSTTVPSPTTTTRPARRGEPTVDARSRPRAARCSTPAATLSFRGELLGAVSAAGTLTLRRNGKAVSSLLAGRYTFKVTDRSKTNGFTIQEIRQNATTVTGTSFTGKRSLTLALKSGQWFYYGSFVGKKSYFIVVS